MSTSLLYHGWGIRDYKYLSTRYEKGQVIFVVEPNPDHLRCPVCKGSDWIFNGFRWRTLHGLPIGNRRVLIETKIPKLQCHKCDSITEIDPPFAEPYRTYITALEQYAIELCRITTIKGAAQITGLSWHVVKSIDKRYLKKKYAKISIKDVRHIAIDEFAVRKGHRYMTDIVDLQTGRILFVANGKDSTAIIPFLKRFKRRNSMSLKAIAVDMSVPFTCALRDTLPEVPLVYDHFHIMQKMNEQLDKLGRRLMGNMAGEQKRFIKGVRYLILMGDKKLEETEKNKPGSKQRLEQALAINQPLNIAYYLRETSSSVEPN